LLIFIVVVGAVLYFVPTYIAVARRHHWIPRIFLVNLLLGWTIIGWVLALHMACTSRTKTNAYWRPTDATEAGIVPATYVPKAVPERAADRPGASR
jgi:hypothetical protein